MADGEDAARDAERRGRDAKRHRERRARLKAASEKAYRDAEDAARTRSNVPSDVPSSVPCNVRVLPSVPLKAPLGCLLEDHFRVCVELFAEVRADPKFSALAKLHAGTNLLKAMPKPVDTSVILGKLEELERRFAARRGA